MIIWKKASTAPGQIMSWQQSLFLLPPTSCPPPGLNKVVIYLKLSFYEQALLWNTEKIKVKRTVYECVSIKSLIVSNFDIFLLINIDY